MRIRFARYGMKKQPSYRIVVADERKPRDGKFIEVLGVYDSRAKEKSLTLDKERYDYWMKNGAKPTQTLSEKVRSQK